MTYPTFIFISSLPHVDYASDTVSLLHIRESLINAIERLSMCDEFVYLEFARHVIVHKIWELRAAFDAAKSAAFPDAASDELECCVLVLVAWIHQLI